jgi:site-specific DNA-methyltransferase (adenine-specific)
LATWLNAGRYFGFHTKLNWNDDIYGEIQSSDGSLFYPVSKIRTEENTIKVYIHGGECWINENVIPRNVDRVCSYKVLIPRSGNPGFGNTIIGKPKISEPYSCSSNTYMVAIPSVSDMSEEEAYNLCSYIKTKFVRLLVATKTSTQSTPPDAFQFVPLQDFSHLWTDEMLYKKYRLKDDEIAFIESMIRPME